MSTASSTMMHPPPKDWENRKSQIREIYISQNRPLRKLQQIMRKKHNFKATAKQYRTQFKRWGPEFRKYRGRRSRQRQVTSSNASANRPDARREPTTSPLMTSNRLLYSNAYSKQCELAMFLQLELFKWFQNDPRWTNLSEFEYPGAPRLYQVTKCVLLHYKVNDLYWGVRFLRRAFCILNNELPGGDPNYIQDVALNVSILLIRHRSFEIGSWTLRHCSKLLTQYPGKHLQSIFFGVLSKSISQDAAQSLCLFQRLLELYAYELERTRCTFHRTSNQAQRRHLQIIRDGNIASTAEELKDLIDRNEDLLKSAITTLGPLHDRTLRIENETLRIRNYVGIYDRDFEARVENSISKVALHANQAGDKAFQQWAPPYQDAFLRFFERLFEYYKCFSHRERHRENALKSAQQIMGLGNYRTERWVLFSLQVEGWLQKQRLVETYDYWRSKRLESSYYQDLEANMAYLW